MANRFRGKTVYVSKFERHRVLKSLKESLETKKHKNDLSRVTQELTVVLMKLMNLKAKFNELEQKENKKHAALGKMIDLVRDNICSLLQKEDANAEEISVVVNRIQHIERFLCRVQQRLNSVVNIDLGADDGKKRKTVTSKQGKNNLEVEKHGDHEPESNNKTHAEKKSLIKQEPIEDDKEPARYEKNKTGAEDKETAPSKIKEGLKKSKVKKKQIYEKDIPKEQRRNTTGVDRNTYPYGFRDINMRKDQNSPERRNTVGHVTTSIPNIKDDKDIKMGQVRELRDQKRRDRSVLPHAVLEWEPNGTGSMNENVTAKNPDSKVLSQNLEVSLKSSCIFNKLGHNGSARKSKLILLEGSSSSSLSEKVWNVKEKVFNCKLQNMDRGTKPSKVHKNTSYDDFILRPNFSWNNPLMSDITRKTSIIDPKTWKYKENDYCRKLKVKSPKKLLKHLKTRGTNTPKSFNIKIENFSQTDNNIPYSVHQVCFFQVLYTSSYFQPVVEKALKFQNGPSIIDKSKDVNGFSYITCRADPDNSVVHFTLIQNGGTVDMNVQQESAHKLQQVKDMWVQQTKDFFSQTRINSSNENLGDSLSVNMISSADSEIVSKQLGIPNTSGSTLFSEFSTDSECEAKEKSSQTI